MSICLSDFLPTSPIQSLEVIFLVSLLKALDVQQLLLSVNSLTKLPENFGKRFLHLRELDLSCNELAYLPASFGELSQLKFLDLSRNKIRGLPKTFRDLASLKYLDLSANQIDVLGVFHNHIRNDHLNRIRFVRINDGFKKSMLGE